MMDNKERAIGVLMGTLTIVVSYALVVGFFGSPNPGIVLGQFVLAWILYRDYKKSTITLVNDEGAVITLHGSNADSVRMFIEMGYREQ